jgi:RNA-directed DNA polymerase
MKRFGNLFQGVCSFQALAAAAFRAARGKKKKLRVAAFLMDLENEVIELEAQLRAGTYRPRPYRTFTVKDPKVRRICAADFRDRVVHHAVCGVLEPIWERGFINDTYACRTGRGTHRAVAKAQRHCRQYGFFLKLDVRKFFDSVDHDILKTMLRGKVKDPDLLWLLDVFIDHPVPWTRPGKGIPIGNLTSQHFANLYLSGLDHMIKEQLRIRGYIRYMDDMVLFADKKSTLWEAARRIEAYLEEKLRLTVKTGSLYAAPVRQGLSFLGFRVFPGTVRIHGRGWRRFRRKAMALEKDLVAGRIDESTRYRSMAGLLGHMTQGDTRCLRASFFNRPGAAKATTA